LEGEWETTFPEVSREYIVRDGRQWFSLDQGKWISFPDYIKEFTQVSPLGILPTLLGFSRTDYPLYRGICRSLYAICQQKLKLNLDKLST